MSVCFSIYWLLEESFGKLNRLAPFVILIITPLTSYFFNIFGFPLRLKLTEIAGSILNQSGLDIQWKGNQILLSGEVFSVDPACMGLNLVITSFLISLLILNSLEQHKKREISLKATFIYLLATAIFIVFTNLARIVLLILFRSAPESFSHQLIGMFCLICITVIPIILLAYYLIGNGKEALEKKTTDLVINKRKLFFYTILILGLTISQFKYGNYIDIPEDKLANVIHIDHFEKNILANNIIKFQNPDAIIYIKPSKGVFRSGHNPKVCWKGSGYLFQKERTEIIGGNEVYLAELHLGNEILHTAWWYDNGKIKTNSQLDWRLRTLQGEPEFRLINVTTETESQLQKSVEKLIVKNLFNGS